MKLQQLCQLDQLAELIAKRRGECRYCTVTHERGQCQKPRNASYEQPSMFANARADIWEANERGSQAAFERQLQREFVRRIKL